MTHPKEHKSMRAIELTISQLVGLQGRDLHPQRNENRYDSSSYRWDGDSVRRVGTAGSNWLRTSVNHP
jgi:hypothetical protein